MKTVILFLLIIISYGAYAAEPLNNVLIVSIDALHPDAVTEKNAPNILKAAEKGVVRLNGKSTNPPKTLVSHTAMFTGVRPEDGGRSSNVWEKGDAKVKGRTIFHMAKDSGYGTAYIYSKGKLAFLENPAAEYSEFSKEYPIDKTIEYMNKHVNNFVFLHISGLDQSGPEFGWMSQEYIEDFHYIDEELKPLLEKVQKKGKYLIIITSDHAGHGKEHGCSHPDDYKLPFAAASDTLDVESEVAEKYETYKLIEYLQSVGVL